MERSTLRRASGVLVVVGAFVLLYALAAVGDLTPALVASTLPIFGLGAALLAGGGILRRYLHHLHASGGDSSQ